jgi:hypothetical protein
LKADAEAAMEKLAAGFEKLKVRYTIQKKEKVKKQKMVKQFLYIILTTS